MARKAADRKAAAAAVPVVPTVPTIHDTIAETETTVAGVLTAAPGIVAGQTGQTSVEATLKRKFRFKVVNDYAGRFEGLLEGESEEQVYQYLFTQLTRGIEIVEVI